MRMVGRSRGLVHRRYKLQSKRWMYRPKHKKRISFEGIWLYIEMCLVTFALMLTMFVVWWNFC